MTNKTIFWDMDRTLGVFDHISREMQNRTDVDDLPPFGLRSGIEELLAELSSKGYTQYITSSATGDYVAEALKRTGINKYFDKIYSRENIGGAYSPKNYKKILDEMDMLTFTAGDNIIIIGDKGGDVPNNMDNIVTILDSVHFLRDASLTKIMINMLEENGQDSFHKGFMKLYDTSKNMSKEYDFLKPVGKLILDNDTILHLKFMESRENCSGAPIFKVYSADKYLSYKIKQDQEKK